MRLQQVLGRLTPAVSLLAMLVAVLDLIGWWLGQLSLVRVVPMPHSGVMMPNTAVGLFLCGASLWLARKPGASSLRRGVSHALALAAVVLGGLTLSEYLFGVDLGIDLILFPETVRSLAPYRPGRAAPATTLCFILTGLSLRWLDAETRGGHRPAQYLALLLGGVASLALLGYLYMEEGLVASQGEGASFPLFTRLSVHTAATFLALSLGLLCARPERGLMKVFTGDDAGGFMARRLLPAAIFVPTVVGAFQLMGMRRGMYGSSGGVAIFVVITTSVLLILIAWNAASLRRLDLRRRELEKAARLSEARLSGIVSNAADAIISIDEHQRIALFNASAERVFGYSAGEVLGQPLDILLPPRLRAIHRQHVRDFAAGPRTTRRLDERPTLLGLRKSGEEFPAEASVSKVDVGGTMLMTAILRDSTERKRAEEALRESEERFRTAYENAAIGMALVGLDGRFLNVNRSLCEIVGYSERELLARTFQDITWPADLEVDLENARRLREGEISSYQLEKRYIHKKGHLVTVLLTGSLVHDSRGEPLYFIAQIQDISERKRLEQDWRFLADTGPQLAGSLDSRATLGIVARLVVPALADWCVIDLLDEEGKVVAVEGAAASARQEATLRTLLSLYSHDPARHGHIASRVIRTGEPALLPEIPHEVLEETAEDERHLELLLQLEPRSGMVVPLFARGHTLGAIILAASESGRRYDARSLMLAEELARRAALAIDNARLYMRSEQATRVRDEVLRIVAHDLRTPLQVVSLSTQTLLKRLPEERPADRKQLESIQKAVARSNRLIQDLLDVARLEAGRIAVERRPEPLAPLVREVLELHRTLAEARSIQLTVSIPEDCPDVLADRDRLVQILSNLLGNALKFTPEGGQISLRVEPAGDMLRLSVQDTGLGIPEQSLPHLFEPFWQAQGGRRNGAGLGLAIVKGLVEAHDGQVWVESRPGLGSTFFFTLPTVARAEAHLAH
ncbi:sensor histidine kinase [Hyalangium gracile]|uniref:sensor histidine kinase n=1 Tax=Hyalangium gracile TaxID=394092 RepID=UPI001CCBADA1|nr:PAS domain S-box protein [Hyalangium gracile]